MKEVKKIYIKWGIYWSLLGVSDKNPKSTGLSKKQFFHWFM